MTLFEGTEIILLLTLLVLLCSGIAVIAFKGGRAYSTMTVGIALLLLIGAIGYSWSDLIHEGFQARPWVRGWVLPRDDLGALAIGILQDPQNLAVALLVALLAGLVLLSRRLLGGEPRPERLDGALAITTAGVGLVWVSLTPWLGFMGVAITLLGGFIALGSRWESDEEARFATHFAWEKSWGLVLAWIGMAVLAGARTALIWTKGQDWSLLSPAGAAIHPKPWSDLMGASLVATGLFIQFQSFPFLGWVILPTKVSPVVRILVNQVLPAFAAFALLLHMEPQLRAIGLFPAFGWVALAAAVLTLATALFQSDWRRGLGAWTSAGLSLAFAALAFSGEWSGLSLLIGVGLGACAFAHAAEALDRSNGEGAKYRVWARAATFGAMASGTGLFGFLSGAGAIRCLAQSWSLPGAAGAMALFGVAFFMLALEGWKLAWSQAPTRHESAAAANWFSICVPFLLILLGTAVLWTGAATGEALPGNPDGVLPSLFDLFFPPAVQIPEGDSFSALWTVVGIQAAAFVLAYWTAGRRTDRWRDLGRAVPRTAKFVGGGYGLDSIAKKARGGITAAGRFIEWLVDEKIWGEWLPSWAVLAVKNGSRVVALTESKMTDRLNRVAFRAVNIPGKVLQLVQNGDVQWYVLLAVGSGVAILLHFFTR